MTNDASKKWFDRACRVMPGGVNSPVRAFGAVGGSPPFIERAEGCYLFDADGRRYVEYIGSWGPMILGHGHAAVRDALDSAIEGGTSFGAPCPQEVLLAEQIVARIPSIEMVRMVNSGTEATASAVRLARAATGRERIVKFEGCYHGHVDALLAAAGSGVATLSLPDSPGVPRTAVESTIVVPFNDADAVREVFKRHGDEIAAVIVEPIAGNMGVVPPTPGFLESLRDITVAHDSLLIFDEVMTGFRVGPAGAQGLYGITPDLTTLGKIIGGGLPVGAYGGRADLMKMVAPAGPVYQAGTLSGNPLAMTAGLATLQQLTDEAYATLEERTSMLERGLLQSLEKSGARGQVQRAGSMLTLFFTDRPVRCFKDAQATDAHRFAAFFHAMLARGIHLPPSRFEAWFISLAHTKEIIDETIAAAADALAEITASSKSLPAQK